jgi:endoglucanase
MSHRFRFARSMALPALLLTGCSSNYQMVGPPGTSVITPTDAAGPAVGPSGLHVVGNQIQDSAGNPVVLHGVNRSGTEYKCVQSGQIFDGPSDSPSVAAIASWPNVNAVRVPLNESCWLGINGAQVSPQAYVSAIQSYVALLHAHGLVPILDLHWVGPGAIRATMQWPMPDADHAAAFWTDVTTAFASDTGVVFDLYNEPFPDSNRDSDAAWQCWRDGCTANTPSAAVTAGAPATYSATGLQSLVTAVRMAEAGGPSHLIVLGGVQYSNLFTQWLAYQPMDPASNLAASWHVYNFNGCKAASCWDAAPAQVAASVPLVATEIGENDCTGAFITPLMQWLDGKSAGYLAWSWNAFAACTPAMGSRGGSPYSLVADYTSGRPNGSAATGTATPYAQAFHDHVAGL